MLALTTRRKLQRLRFLLDEALARTQDPTEIGRHAALILLDGACEYAIDISLHHRGQIPPQNFPQKLKTLRTELGWSADTWGSIGDLHSARNGAQHHGVSPDSSNMPGWATEAQRFVEGLVSEIFGVELRSVLLAEAVARDDVRLQLVDAEKALEQEDGAGALSAIFSAFDVAREAWRSQRVETVGPLQLQYTGINALGGADTDPTNNSLIRFEDLLEVQPFAPDIGEYHWLLARRAELDDRKPELAPSYETAQRAFLFVVAWVLRWEAFAARYESRRYAPPEPPYEPPTTGADIPTIYSRVVETQHHTGSWLDPPALANVRYLVRLALRDVPTEDRELWAAEVGDVLDEVARARHSDDIGAARVGADGIIRFHGVSANVTGEDLLQWVDDALTEGGRRYQQKLRDREVTRIQLPNQIEALEAAVRAANAEGLVEDVVSTLRDDGVILIGARLRRDPDDPMLGHLLDGVVHTARSGHPTVDYWETTLWFPVETDPQEAARLLEDVRTSYEEAARTRQQGLSDVELRRQALEEELGAGV